MFFRINLCVAQPRNVQVVISCLDRFTRERPPTTSLALIFALTPAIRIVAVRFFEIREVLYRQRTSFAKRGRVWTHVVDPYGFGVGLIGLASLEEQNIGLYALRIED